MSTHNIGFYEDLTKIIFQLSSNTHLISSSDEEQRATIAHLRASRYSHQNIFNSSQVKEQLL